MYAHLENKIEDNVDLVYVNIHKTRKCYVAQKME